MTILKLLQMLKLLSQFAQMVPAVSLICFTDWLVLPPVRGMVPLLSRRQPNLLWSKMLDIVLSFDIFGVAWLAHLLQLVPDHRSFLNRSVHALVILRATRSVIPPTWYWNALKQSRRASECAMLCG